ncbi:MAG: hypothetical protein Q8M01_07455 [Rubrivivax sp.]|nr:hypothetical protein [Rubrivivax sp.]
MPRSPHQAGIDRYLRTGEHDELSPHWPGDNFLARVQFADSAARKALVAAVRRRTTGAVAPAALADIDLPVFTRAKLAPMVHGLFAEQEHGTVLDALERSVVFLTPATIEAVLVTGHYPLAEHGVGSGQSVPVELRCEADVETRAPHRRPERRDDLLCRDGLLRHSESLR